MAALTLEFHLSLFAVFVTDCGWRAQPIIFLLRARQLGCPRLQRPQIQLTGA